MSDVQQAFHSPLSPRQLFALEHKKRRFRMEARAVHDDGIVTPYEARRLKRIKDAAGAEERKIARRLKRVEKEKEFLRAMRDKHLLVPFVLPSPQPVAYPSLGLIQSIVAKHFDLPVLELLSARRTANVVRPRQVAMYLAKTLTPRSLPEIGRRFGGRDHTTVLHAVRKIEALRLTDPKLNEEIKQIEASITAALAMQTSAQPSDSGEGVAV